MPFNGHIVCLFKWNIFWFTNIIQNTTNFELSSARHITEY